MKSDTDLIVKMFASLAPLIPSSINYSSKMKSDRQWRRNAEKEVGNLGFLFFFVNKIPYYFHEVSLGILIFLALVSLSEGALIITNIEYPTWLPNIGIINYAHWILISSLILFVIINYNFLSFFLSWFSALYPPNTYNIGWINAKWHLQDRDKAIPINIDHNNCEYVANKLINALIYESNYNEDRAPSFIEICEEERANIYLFGCIVENNIHKFKLQYEKGWRHFYESLGEMANSKQKPFLPQKIKDYSFDNATFFQLLSDNCQNEINLAEYHAIKDDVYKTLNYLRDKHGGSAKSIAYLFPFKKPMIWLAEKRSARIPGLTGPENESIRFQFLKLATGNGVWRSIDPGGFVFAFSRNLSKLLFDLNCLITLSTVKVIPLTNDNELRKLISTTQAYIIDLAHQILVKSDDRKIITMCSNKFGCIPAKVSKWSLSYEINYLLWHIAHKENKARMLFGERFKDKRKWRIENNCLVRDQNRN